MRKLFYLLPVIALISILGCDRPCCGPPVPVFVYKFNDTSYARLLQINYDSISGQVMPLDSGVAIINGYYESYSYYANAITFVLNSDYRKAYLKNSNEPNWNLYIDSLKYKIISGHPYSELYNVTECTNGDNSTALDNLIRNNQLGKCLTLPLP